MKSSIRTLAVPSSKKDPQNSSIEGLTPHQKHIFRRIQLIKGTDSIARRQVEKLLRELSDEKVTEELAKSAKTVLTARGWGIRCSCGQPAALLWMIAAKCAEGGKLCFSHYTDGKRCIHGGNTSFPVVEVVPKADRRFR